MKIIAGPVIAGLLVVGHCALAQGEYGPVPIDEDEQRVLIDASAAYATRFANQSLLHDNEAVLSLVRKIGHSLVPPPTDDYIDYEFFVIRDPSPNAFSLPNGHIFVHTGMLSRLQDESQLAALLSHEISHVAGHHSILNDRSANKKAVAIAVAGGIASVMPTGSTMYGNYCMDCAWVKLIASSISAGLSASIFGFKRELEQEADNRALLMLRDSDYDPHAFVEVLEVLSIDYEGLSPRVPAIWSDHPSIEQRIGNALTLGTFLPSRDRDTDEFEFEIAVRPVRKITIRDYLDEGYIQTALALATALMERHPDDVESRVLLADAWLAMGPHELIDREIWAQWSDRDKRRYAKSRISGMSGKGLEELLESEEGRAALAANVGRAKEIYAAVLDMNPDYAPAYRSLGDANDALSLYREAAESYLAYLKLAPDADDRAIVLSRLRNLTDKIKQEGDNP